MKKIINIFACLALLFFIVQFSSAAVLEGNSLGQLEANTKKLGAAGGLVQGASVGSIIAGIIQVCLGLLGAIFLSLMIIAGFQWMTAGGNEAQVKKAKDIITTAVIGLVVVLAAYAITYFVFKYLPFSGSSTGASTNNGGVTNTP
jgi:hypothetical protein